MGSEPRFLGFLKFLVAGLGLIMAIGLIVLVVLFVKRFPHPGMDFPADIALPAGAKVTAMTRGPGWLAVVTEDGRILIFAPDGQTLLREVDVVIAPEGETGAAAGAAGD